VEGYEVSFCRECKNALTSLRKIKIGVEKITSENVWKARKIHEKIKIGVSACPNACSSPQIKDFGVIVFVEPAVDFEKCNSCKACLIACKESAITFKSYPAFNDNCIGCGDCMRVCKNSAIRGKVRFKVLAGGRLGRHPRFAETVATVESADDVLKILEEVISISTELGKRFSYIPNAVDVLRERIEKLALSEAE